MRVLALTTLLVAAHALVTPPRRVTRREAAPSSDEFPADAPARSQGTYLDRLAAYADEDGYTLDAPTRYSIADWWLNLRNLPSSSVLQRVQGHLVANTFFAILVSGLAYAIRAGAVDLSLDTALLETDHLNLGAPFELSGGILGILLAFRTSQSYDRFWEGRQVWAKVRDSA